MLNKIYKTLPFLTLFVLPIFANAQVLSKTTTLFTQAKFIVTTILIPLVFALALLLFFWGVAKYIWSEGQGKEDGKKIMIWGVVALFVMSAVWGLVAFIEDELLGGQSPGSSPIPTIGGYGGSGSGSGGGGGGSGVCPPGTEEVSGNCI